MAIIPVGYAQANFRFTGVPLPTGAEVTLGLDVGLYSGGPDDVAEDLEIQWNSAEMFNFYATTVSLSEIAVKFGPESTGPSAARTVTSPGTQPTPPPPNTCTLITKNTAFGGRAGRGRMYLPTCGEGDISADGLLGSSFVTGRQTDIDNFGAGLALALLTPVVLHGAGSPITTPSPITSFTVQNKVATQRRRLRR